MSAPSELGGARKGLTLGKSVCRAGLKAGSFTRPGDRVMSEPQGAAADGRAQEGSFTRPETAS